MFFSVDLHDFGALLKEIFFSIIKMIVIQKGRNLVSFYRNFYYNLFLELEQSFWIHPRDHNRKLGISDFLLVIKTTVIKKGCNLLSFYQNFYYNLFLELETTFWIHPREQNRKLGISGVPFGNKKW